MAMKLKSQEKTEPNGSRNPSGHGRVGAPNHLNRNKLYDDMFLSTVSSARYTRSSNDQSYTKEKISRRAKVLSIKRYYKLSDTLIEPLSGKKAKVVCNTGTPWDDYPGVMLAVDAGDRVADDEVRYAAWLWLTTPIPNNVRWLPWNYFLRPSLRKSIAIKNEGRSQRSQAMRGNPSPEEVARMLFPPLPSKIWHRGHEVREDNSQITTFSGRKPSNYNCQHIVGRVKYTEELIQEALIREVTTNRFLDAEQRVHRLPIQSRLIRYESDIWGNIVGPVTCRYLFPVCNKQSNPYDSGLKYMNRVSMENLSDAWIQKSLRRYLENEAAVEPELGDVDKIQLDDEADPPWDSSHPSSEYGIGPLQYLQDVDCPESARLRNTLAGNYSVFQQAKLANDKDKLWIDVGYPLGWMMKARSSFVPKSVTPDKDENKSSAHVNLTSNLNWRESIRDLPHYKPLINTLRNLVKANPLYMEAMREFVGTQEYVKKSNLTAHEILDEMYHMLTLHYDREVTNSKATEVNYFEC